MSADNSYFVIGMNGMWSVQHGFMSPFCEQEGDEYSEELFYRGVMFSSRADALEFAHDAAFADGYVEYGVTEVVLEPSVIPGQLALGQGELRERAQALLDSGTLDGPALRFMIQELLAGDSFVDDGECGLIGMKC